MHRRAVMSYVFVSLMLLAASLAGGQGPGESSKFLRFNDLGEAGATLDSSIVRYRNAEGVVVDLIGAVHIGEAAYFQALSDRFDNYDALLFELIKPVDGAVPGQPATRPASAPDRGATLRVVGGLQGFMKNVLKLSFQLEEINYHRRTFVHADLDGETFARLQDERGESMFVLMLRSIIQGSRNKNLARHAPGPMDILNAMRAPDRDRQLKLLLGRQMGDIDAMTQLLDGPRGSVILTERNSKAVEVLRQQMKAGKRELGIFYGAAHMIGIEQMLLEMGFEQVGEPQWITAWDMRVGE
ncbi:MAG TPA: hypothetical protein PKB10_08875 [Tepidisphaeraceae bacterium]|nr:hypothetical protein [Tepidisphaeraceae bacterium]